MLNTVGTHNIYTSGHIHLIMWTHAKYRGDLRYGHVQTIQHPCILSETLTFVLVKWFAAHPDSWERDRLCRPCCPGEFSDNHCLWRYAVTDRPRRLMSGHTSTFRTNISMFGRRDTRERKQLWDMETSAYYGLIKPSSILSTVSMSREYDSDSMKHTDDWLETVTVA